MDAYTLKRIKKLRRRASKVMVTVEQKTGLERFLNSLSCYTGHLRITNGNAWDAPWILAGAGETALARNGCLFPTLQAAMDAMPAFKAALMRRYVPDYRPRSA